MPRQAATKTYANFSGGLITEASILSYPENAASDIDNLDLVEDGSVQRRPGLAFDASEIADFPVGHPAIALTATNVFKWESVNGDPNLNIAVVQASDELHFYYLRDDLVSTLPEDAAADSIVLAAPLDVPSDSTFLLRSASDVQVSSGGGRLYVAGKYIDPFVLTFTAPEDPETKGTIDQRTLKLTIRDFVIAEEGNFLEGFSLSGEKKQDYMSGAHFYNLANQGWTSTAEPFEIADDVVEGAESLVSVEDEPDNGAQLADPALYTYTKLDYFPTVAHNLHAFQAGGGSSVQEQIAYSPWLTRNDYIGNTPAGRGRFLKEAFYIRRAAIGKIGNALATQELTDGLSYDEVEFSRTRPEAVTFYAGRVWYAGLQGGDFTNNVYFSQVIGDDVKKAAKCYQEADPTSEDINQLVATDGGVFNLEEVGKIHRLEPVGPSLVIIADNGVWVISGDGESSSFSADSFSIRKITDQGAINAESVAFAKDAIYYWGDTALYVLRLNEVGILVASDITSSTIKRFFQRTAGFSKQSSFSVFDQGANRIMWFYSDTEDPAFDNFPNKGFNQVLYYDITLGAFGKYSLGTTPSIMPVSAINANILTSVLIEDFITDGGVVVTVDGEDLTNNTTVFVPDRSSIKVLTIVGDESAGWNYRFSDFTDIVNFADWDESYISFIETGFDSLQDIVGKSKKAPFLQAHMLRTETGFEVDPEDPEDAELILVGESSCLLSYAWDWASTYKNQFQAYRLLKNYTPSGAGDDFEYDRDVISTRNRLRGRGTSLGLRFESEENKDMRLLGYGIVFSTRGIL